MKILAIRIKNLASLEGSTEIDFTSEPLCSAGIFAITGSTGAGKSTILDALCLALYGQTPRYLQARETGIEIQDVQGSTMRQGDVRGILRDGTADGFAEVDFAGIDGQRYRATWMVRRARNKADGSMQSDSMLLKNLTANLDVPGKKTEILAEITRVVGLNFEQFTRSVLLAQGDFTAFMKASKDEKSSLLEKLTGTHIYSEISKKVFEHCRYEDQQLRDLTTKMQGIVILSEEEKKLLLEEQEALLIQSGQLEKHLEVLDQEINWHLQCDLFSKAALAADDALKTAQFLHESSHARRHKLFLTQQVQQTRSWTDALQAAKKQQVLKTEALHEAEANIKRLQLQESECGAKLEWINQNLKDKTRELETAIPLLSEARQLDTILVEKDTALDSSRKETTAAAQKRNAHLQLIEEKTGNLAKMMIDIQDLTKWQSEHQNRKSIAENSDIILSKLDDASFLGQAQKKAETATAELQRLLAADIARKETLAVKINSAEEQARELQKAYEELAKELLLIPVEKLNVDKDQADREIQETTRALGHWQQLNAATKELGDLQSELASHQENRNNKEILLKEISSRTVILQANRDTSQQLYKQAQLAAAENVEALRSGLQPEMPCPVCGSTSHPFVTNTPALHSVMSGLEESYKKAEEKYLESFGVHKALEQEYKTIDSAISRITEELPARSSAFIGLQDNWQKFTVSNEMENIPSELRADAIEAKLDNLKIVQSALQLHIQSHTQLRATLEKHRESLDREKENLQGLIRQLQTTEQSLALNSEKLSGKNTELANAGTALQDIILTLSPYFTHSDWIEHWKESPDLFATKIRDFTATWKDASNRLEQFNINARLLQASLSDLHVQEQELTQYADRQSAALLILEKQYGELKQRRSSLFEGVSADEIEIKLQQAVSGVRNQLEEYTGKQQSLAVDCAKEIARRDALGGELKTASDTITSKISEIEDWLQQFNAKHQTALNFSQLNELLALTHEWIANEQLELNAIEEGVTKATAVLSERQQLLADHRKNRGSAKALEELQLEKLAVKEDLNGKKLRINEIGFRFRQDQANSEAIGGLLQQISKQQAITDNWSRLNEIIGSADGKKFRQIAQEYTLDVLLGYANVHLSVLSSRYRIERIPSSLGLQVVDQDMGDEVRTVYSLSGGESFLVSLALALGLASLSSTRMQVESLFIDEGFGSLDPLTLNIAMDALERLHNQGRKVGVISHVQEMTERIPVQIRVSKMSSGKSKVEIG